MINVNYTLMEIGNYLNQYAIYVYFIEMNLCGSKAIISKYYLRMNI